VTLGVWLPKDAPLENREFHVSAPAAVNEGGRSFSEVRHGVENELQPGRAIATFKDLESAADAFDKALAKIAA
jgi:hypothetical protein